MPFDPTRLWRSPKALERARNVALRVARQALARRREAGGVQPLAMESHHEGSLHLEAFERHLRPLISTLPPKFRALEVGAGMGWHAALIAAHSEGRVLATEITWPSDSPHKVENAHTFHRMMKRAPALANVIELGREPSGELVGVHFGPRIGLACASGHALPVADEALDFVYSINCLEHIPAVGRALDEAARVLREGGIHFATTQPLFFSAQGGHLEDLFPIPWGHLLWESEELAALVVREAGPDREWLPGEPLQSKHVRSILDDYLNFATPAEIRGALKRGPWMVRAWMDFTDASDETLAHEMSLRDALKGVSPEALFLTGLHMVLEKRSRPHGLRAPLRLTHRTRRQLRKLWPR